MVNFLLLILALLIYSFAFSFLARDAAASSQIFSFVLIFLVVSASVLNQCLVYVCSDLSVSPEIFLRLALFMVGEALSLLFMKSH